MSSGWKNSGGSAVDEDGDVQPRRGGPDRVKRRIVDGQTRAVGLPCGQAEPLADLADAKRAGLDVGFELRHGLLGPTRPNAIEADAGENADAILERAVADDVQCGLQPL